MKLSSSEPLVPRYADDVKLFVKLFEWDGLYSPLAWGLGSPPRWARSGAQGLSADGDPWCQGVKGQLMEEAGGSFGSWVSPVQNHVNSRAEESSNLGEKTATWMANTNKKPLLALARRSTGDRKRISHGRKAAGGTCCCCCCCNQGDSSKNVMKPTDFFVRQETCHERLFGLVFFFAPALKVLTPSEQTDRQTPDGPVHQEQGSLQNRLPRLKPRSTFLCDTALMIDWRQNKRKNKESFLVEVSLTGELCELCEITWVVRRRKKKPKKPLNWILSPPFQPSYLHASVGQQIKRSKVLTVFLCWSCIFVCLSACSIKNTCF